MDLAGLEVKEERLERRRSFGSQMQSSVFSELICSRSGYTLKDHSLILSETKKERDAVIGSSLLNIGMTAKLDAPFISNSSDSLLARNYNFITGIVGSEPVKKAVMRKQVSVFQLPEKGKVDSYNGSIKK
ncbi:Membrane-anchored ubiquitin-fold protein 3 [Olea europaea subsp. europaea]|uniref:Membrane-anchored ubiquitin-fold protein 3 n=1 Tax=Olea europaea subsp. europaea TaxID=158383 RepID=A0A8S0P7L2_OLEEU|nr:Membrane-anchored ubiquitin-fold protein 3 [Olea europaea subsp. europaea]